MHRNKQLALVVAGIFADPRPKPVAPPPPPPPPAPKPERTIILDDVLFDFDRSNIKPEAAVILDRLVVFMSESENRNRKASLPTPTASGGKKGLAKVNPSPTIKLAKVERKTEGWKSKCNSLRHQVR